MPPAPIMQAGSIKSAAPKTKAVNIMVLPFISFPPQFFRGWLFFLPLPAATRRDNVDRLEFT
jgi:hypothetical protein